MPDQNFVMSLVDGITAAGYTYMLLLSMLLVGKLLVQNADDYLTKGHCFFYLSSMDLQ